MSHTPPELDLSQLDDAIIEQDLKAESSGTPPEPAPVQDTPEPEAPPAEPAAEPVAAAPEEKPAQPADELPTDVEELKRGYMRGKDYTQKRMADAAVAKELAAEREKLQAARKEQELAFQELAAWRQLSQEPEKLEAFAQQLRQPGVDPETPLTVAQAQQLFEQRLTAALAKERQEAENRIRAAEVLRYEHQYLSDLDAHTTAEVAKHPLVSRISGIGRLIIEEVRARQPQNIAEFKKQITDVAAEIQAREAKFKADLEQAAIMRYAKTNKPSIEPPGGSAPAAVGQVNDYKLGSDELNNVILQDLLARKI